MPDHGSGTVRRDKALVRAFNRSAVSSDSTFPTRNVPIDVLARYFQILLKAFDVKVAVVHFHCDSSSYWVTHDLGLHCESECSSTVHA